MSEDDYIFMTASLAAKILIGAPVCAPTIRTALCLREWQVNKLRNVYQPHTMINTVHETVSWFALALKAAIEHTQLKAKKPKTGKDPLE